MHVPDFLARPKALIAAMISFWLAGLAYGETAGRVNFVSGDVVAVNADSTRRTLHRGDLVSSGERLETGDKSRVQIRFTDGSFLALQAKTVFSIDTYTYTRDKPEQSSLVFNFLRGSMRTISGAIGKANRQAYQIKTPTATIGIRGTDYAGVMLDNELLLKVLGGIVNLSNALGNADVLSGQTFNVRLGSAPAPFNGKFPADVDAIEPDVDAATGESGVTKTTAGSSSEDMPERPRLENYDNYNQFLQAMYAFKKAEAARAALSVPAVTATPLLDLEKFKNMAPIEADMDTETVEAASTPSLVTEGPETIEQAVAMAEKLKFPRYTPGENYHRSTFKDFPLIPVEQPTLENAAINDTFKLGQTTNNMLLNAAAVREDSNGSNNQFSKADLLNKKITLQIERGDHVLRIFGNVVQIQGLDDISITILERRNN